MCSLCLYIRHHWVAVFRILVPLLGKSGPSIYNYVRWAPAHYVQPWQAFLYVLYVFPRLQEVQRRVGPELVGFGTQVRRDRDVLMVVVHNGPDLGEASSCPAWQSCAC